MGLLHAGGFIILAALLLSPAWAHAQASARATALLNKWTTFQPQIRSHKFGEPLHLISNEKDGHLEGDVYAELDLPFARVAAVLGSPDSVCAMLFLHLNVRSCQVGINNAVPQLALSAGPKQTASMGGTYSMVYAMQVDAGDADFRGVKLSAPHGPLSTTDYAIVIEATPLDAQRSFLHFGYAYNYGSLAKVAMGIYLASAGRTKIGFTVVGTDSDGKLQYVQGERGSLERNVMRNYLALKAYASVQTGTPQAQMEARMRTWFALTERHPAQLHELNLDEYLQEKHADLTRMGAIAQ
jgi:hypothetical protein